MPRATEFQHDDLVVERRTHRSVVYLRAAIGAIARVTRALDLPGDHRSRPGNPAVHWNGRGQWLLTSDEFSADEIRTALQPHLTDTLVGIADLSAAFACLDVRGAGAPRVLSSGCCLDFHLQCHPIGQSTRTGFARIPVLIVRTREDAFDVYADGSYSGYLGEWFRTASGDATIGQ